MALTTAGWMPDYELDDYVDSQLGYCWEHHVPIYIPRNGLCPRCHYPIFGTKAYNIMQASATHLTHCPHCGHHFNEQQGGI